MLLDELTQELNYFTLLLSVAKLQQEVSPAQCHRTLVSCSDGQVNVMAESVKESLSCKMSQHALHMEIVRAAPFDLSPVIRYMIH